VAEVDRQVNLIVLRNVDDALLVFHVYCHEFIADFWSVFGVILETKLLVLNVMLHLWVVVQFDAFAFDFLAPTVFVQAFAEEDDVGQDCLVVILVDSIAHAV